MTLPDPAPILDLMEAFRRSKVLFTAVAMGVFDRLHDGPASAAELAVNLGANPDALARLLDACAVFGLLRKTDGRYTNEPITEAYLYTGSPHSIHGYIRYSDAALYSLWSHLEDAVREGTNRWKQTFGSDGPIFSNFFRTPDAMRVFLLAMHGTGMLASPSVVSAFDLSRFRQLVDLGGGTGHLAIAACEEYPNLTGTVFDLPQVVPTARECVEASRVADRIEVIPGDFFTDDLPPADLYAVGRILHDWSETKIEALLRKIFASLPESGGLLVAERLLNSDGVGPIGANMQSLNMLVCTEGRERSLEEYDRMLRAVGFSTIQGRRTGTYLDAILAQR